MTDYTPQTTGLTHRLSIDGINGEGSRVIGLYQWARNLSLFYDGNGDFGDDVTQLVSDRMSIGVSARKTAEAQFAIDGVVIPPVVPVLDRPFPIAFTGRKIVNPPPSDSDLWDESAMTIRYPVTAARNAARDVFVTKAKADEATKRSIDQYKKRWAELNSMCQVIYNSVDKEVWALFIQDKPDPWEDFAARVISNATNSDKNPFRLIDDLISFAKTSYQQPHEVFTRLVTGFAEVIADRANTLEGVNEKRKKIMATFMELAEATKAAVENPDELNRLINYVFMKSLDQGVFGAAVCTLELEVAKKLKPFPSDMNDLVRQIRHHNTITGGLSQSVAAANAAGASRGAGSKGKGIPTGNGSKKRILEVAPPKKEGKGTIEKGSGPVGQLIKGAKEKGRGWNDPHKPGEWLKFTETGKQCTNESCLGTYQQYLHPTANCHGKPPEYKSKDGSVPRDGGRNDRGVGGRGVGGRGGGRGGRGGAKGSGGSKGDAKVGIATAVKPFSEEAVDMLEVGEGARNANFMITD